MNLPSNVRSLVALGFFCTVAGAWLTFLTEARTRSLRAELFSESTATSAGSSSDLVSHPLDLGAPAFAERPSEQP